MQTLWGAKWEPYIKSDSGHVRAAGGVSLSQAGGHMPRPLRRAVCSLTAANCCQAGKWAWSPQISAFVNEKK